MEKILLIEESRVSLRLSIQNELKGNSRFSTVSSDVWRALDVFEEEYPDLIIFNLDTLSPNWKQTLAPLRARITYMDKTPKPLIILFSISNQCENSYAIQIADFYVLDLDSLKKVIQEVNLGQRDLGVLGSFPNLKPTKFSMVGT